MFFRYPDLQGNRYQGLYKLWVHADKVAFDKQSKKIGLFVLFHVQKLKKARSTQKSGEFVQRLRVRGE